jgi:ATP-dependent Clp protease ATP-binding subunit ClpX
MAYDDVALEFTPEAITAIAGTAIRQKTGARGLRAIVERLMTEVMFEIPSIPGPKRVVINEEIVTKELTPVIEAPPAAKRKTA